MILYNPYILFTNSHDGIGAINVVLYSVVVLYQNTLNLAWHSAKRIWSTSYTENISTKLDEAMKTLLLAEYYIKKLDGEAKNLII